MLPMLGDLFPGVSEGQRQGPSVAIEARCLKVLASARGRSRLAASVHGHGHVSDSYADLEAGVP